MSNGPKAMFERIEEERREEEFKKFNSHTDVEKLRAVKAVLQNLENLKGTNPALTEHGWYYINDSLYELNCLLED